MNEELKETLEEVAEVLEDVTTEPSGNMIGKVIIAGVTLIGAAGTAVVVKKRDAIKKWNDERIVKKLEKKGYIVKCPAEKNVDDSEEEMTEEK